MSEKTTKRAKAADEGSESRGFPKRLAYVLIGLVAAAFVIYSVVSIVGLQGQISERRQELEAIKEEITVQEIKNEEMQKTYDLSGDERSEYIERIARDDLDYVKEGERVFVNVSGD